MPKDYAKEVLNWDFQWSETWKALRITQPAWVNRSTTSQSAKDYSQVKVVSSHEFEKGYK